MWLRAIGSGVFFILYRTNQELKKFAEDLSGYQIPYLTMTLKERIRRANLGGIEYQVKSISKNHLTFSRV